jgi:hypothetical protein
LEIQITDMTGAPIRATVDIDLLPNTGNLGVGGQGMNASLPMGSSLELTITNIACRGGPGTMYRLLANTPHYRPYAFFQLIQEGTATQAADDIEFWVKPGDVKNIRAPRFDDLLPGLQAILTDAQMVTVLPEDKDLAGSFGADLYNKLGPLRKAGLLNIAKKAAHPSGGSFFSLVGRLMVCRQDRFFAMVDSTLPARLRSSPVFQSAPATLHKPLAGFEITGESFKSRDAHANIQYTFQRRHDGALAADIDIDESTGIDHGREVIRNGLFKTRTNPYLIREFLLAADPIERTLNPGYSFIY